MSTQLKRPSAIIVIRRDSVAAGDDLTEHREKIVIDNDETVESTLTKILATHYLPSIQGGKATWIVLGKQPLAIIAQQWSEPYYLVESVAPIKKFINFDFTNNPQLEFKYWCQVEPNEVITSIEQGKPLPDLFGRDKKKPSNVNILERIRRMFFHS